MTEQQKVGPLVEGAFLAVLTAFLGALAIYAMPIKFMVDFIWGVPLIVVVKRYNMRIGLMTAAVTFVITGFMAGPLMTCLLMLELAPLAMIYALFFQKNRSPGMTLIMGTIISTVSSVLTILGYYYLANITLIPTEQTIRTQISEIMNLYVQFGMDPAQAQALAEDVLRTAVALVPSTIALASVVRAFLTYTVAAGVLRRLGYPVAKLPPFSRWKLPWFAVWPFILGLVLSLAGDQFGLRYAAAAGKNLVLALLPIFFLLGLSVGTYFFKTWRIPAWSKLLILVFALFSFDGAIVLITLLGIFDPLAGFRSWRLRPKEK